MELLHTPIELYTVKGHPVYVKREDLCCPPPGPPFAKVRGLMKRLAGLQSRGVKVVGYTETSISMAGWGVAWAARELGMKAVIYDPQYTKPHPVLEMHREKWREFGAELRSIKAGMAKVNYNICRKWLTQEFGTKAIMLPLGLPFPETVEEVAKEYQSIRIPIHNIVICVGSGTMCAGVLRGIGLSKPAHPPTVFGILCRPSKRPVAKKAKIIAASRIPVPRFNFVLLDMGYEYAEASEEPCPFPCHSYYDRKAWEWLVRHIDGLRKNTLFWNIGA